MKQIHEMQGFDWDDANREKNWIRHGVTESESEEVFGNQSLAIVEDKKHSEKEERFCAFGKSNEGRLLSIAFTIRSGLIRIITARPMSKKERRFYEENT
jgi:hypothetical protein